jgi:hypothetical protein
MSWCILDLYLPMGLLESICCRKRKNASPGISRGTYEFQRNLIQNLMPSNRSSPNFRLRAEGWAR